MLGGIVGLLVFSFFLKVVSDIIVFDGVMNVLVELYYIIIIWFKLCFCLKFWMFLWSWLV